MKHRLLLILLALVLIPALGGCGKQEEAPASYGALAITEVMPANKTTLRTPDGNFPDWIEVTNQGAEPVQLSGYGLSNQRDDLMKYTFPDQELAPGASVVVYASKNPSEDPWYAPFSLSKELEDLFLAHSDGTVISQFSYRDAESDLSILPDGTVTRYATPGYPNDDAGYQAWQSSLSMPQGLVISEVANSNDSLVPHDDEVYSDWVELYNNSDQPVDLSGYCLSDDEDTLGDHPLPQETLQPHSYTIIYCDEPEYDEEFSVFVTGFSLGSEERIFLGTPEGVTDGVSIRDIHGGCSYGRSPDGKGWLNFQEPTPGAENGQGFAMIAKTPEPSTPQGVYNDIISLPVVLEGEGTIYYTTDGTEPTTASEVYSAPFQVSKSMVIRAMSVVPGKMDSRILSASYIINENDTLPVLALVTDPANLYDDEKGIYVEGNHENYLYYWERPANISLFENGEQVFSEDCGLQLFGASSRVTEEKKSLRVNFKTKYGASKINCDLFGNGVTKFKSLVMRGGQDVPYAIFRSELMTRLGAETAALTVSDKYCVLYLNGEFFGIHCLMERFSPYYYAQHFGVPENTVAKEEYLLEDDAWMRELVDYAESVDMTTQESYEYFDERIDLDSMIDWFTLEAYAGHKDVQGNVRYMYSTVPGDKLKYCFYDLDLGFNYRSDRYYYLSEDEDYAIICQELLENDTFRRRFIQRTGQVLNTVLTDEKVLGVIDYYADLLDPEVPKERKLWNNGGAATYESWVEDVQDLRDYVTDSDMRESMIEDLDDQIGLSSEEIAILRGER